MSKKHHSSINVPMTKTTDAEGRLVIDSKSIQSTFDPDGTLTFNCNSGVLTWNSGDITHLNFTSDDFMIMFDAETGLITMSAGDKHIYYIIDDLKKQIQEKGFTEEELNKMLIELENNARKEMEEDYNNKMEEISDGSKKEDN